MNRRRTIPTLESLDARIVPSVSPGAPDGVFMPIHVAQAINPHALHGSASGSYKLHMMHPDLGTRYDLVGTAHVAKLGNVTVTGDVQRIGFLATGHATGILTFTNAKGSVTVKLVGPTQPGFAALPTTFTYKIVSGTGHYANVHDSGTLHLVLKPAGKDQGDHGTFKLTI